MHVATDDGFSMLDYRAVLFAILTFLLGALGGGLVGACYCAPSLAASAPSSKPQPPLSAAPVGIAVPRSLAEMEADPSAAPRPPPTKPPAHVINGLVRHISGSKGLGEYQHKISSTREEEWQPVLVSENV